MPSKPYSSRTWIIWSSGLESLVDSLGWVMRGSPFACLVTNVLGDRLWPTLSSRPPGFAFFATLKRRSRALLPQGYLQNKRYTNRIHDAHLCRVFASLEAGRPLARIWR